MAIKIHTIKCPDCGANLPIEEGREKLFCSYCGVPIIITDENVHTYRHIDEVKLKQAEVNQTIQMKKLELIERKRAADDKIKKIKIIISVILGILGLVLMISGADMAVIAGIIAIEAIMLIWLFNNNEDTDIDLGDKVKVPTGISGYEDKTYVVIEALFEEAGFTNIKCVPLRDLKTGILKKPNTVESIIINGKQITSGGKKFSPDVNVVISYHSFSDR